VIWGLFYVIALLLFVVRVRSSDEPMPDPVHPVPGESLHLVRLHHILLSLLLIGPPLEALIIGGDHRGRLAGALLLGAGVLVYRLAGRALGEALSPFTEPRAGAILVTRGLYRYLRHPMYLSQALIALGAPLTLGSRYVIALAPPALLVLALRIGQEEEALARTFPEYPRYAATTKRVLPFVY
jgi:protein-S-isoprenylcysteine O-methyltransferase Ste14